MGKYWRTNNAVSGITCEKIKEFSLMLRHVLKKVFRFGVCCQISTIVWKQTDDDNVDSQTLSLTLTGWLVVNFMTYSCLCTMANLYRRGSIRPPRKCILQKSLYLLLALSMEILKPSAENRLLGAHLGGWPGFTKPNLPALPQTWNIWSSFWGWSRPNFIVGPLKFQFCYKISFI